jgi:hypothetical protein
VTKTYGGAITGTLKDKVTGYQLELVFPGKMQHYTFFVEQFNVMALNWRSLVKPDISGFWKQLT